MAIQARPFNQADFQEFVKLLDFAIRQEINIDLKKALLVLDNARIHRAKNSIRLLEQYSICTLFCSPYSPELNLAERFIKLHKAKLKKSLSLLK
jgi:transposase